MPTYRTRTMSSTLSCLVLTTAAMSATAGDKDGATLYVEKTCASCHGADAKTPVLPVYPKLAGQNPEYLFQQLKDIKSEIRKNAMTAAMAGIMQDVDEKEMRVLSDWLGGLPAD